MERRRSTTRSPCSWVSVLLYTLSLLMTLVAGHFRWKTMYALDQVRQCTRSALQLHTLAVMQDMETYFLAMEADTVEQKAQQELTQMEQYEYDRQVEHAFGSREERRAEYFAHLAQQENEQVDKAKINVRHDEALYQELLQNYTTQQENLMAARNKDQQHSVATTGLCGSVVLSPICNVIEGTLDMERTNHTVNAESILLQQRLSKTKKRMQALERKEILDQIVEQALQRQASRYQQTSQQLYEMAAHFESESRLFEKKEEDVNATFQYLREGEAAIKQQEQKELEWEIGNMSIAEKKLLESQDFYRLSRQSATVACLLTMVPLLLFFSRSVVHILSLCKTVAIWANRQGATTTNVVWRTISQCFLHVVIAMAGLGLVQKSVVNLPFLDWGQRAGTVVWFSFLTAFIQTTFLHVLPNVLCEWPVNAVSALPIMKNGTMRFSILFCLFGIEFLLAWVTFASWMRRAAGPLDTWMFQCVMVCLLLGHVYWFRPTETDEGFDLQENESMLSIPIEKGVLDDDSTSWDTSDELTPLALKKRSVKHDSSTATKGSSVDLTATVAFDLLDLGILAQETNSLWSGLSSTLSSRESSSRYSVDPWAELCALQLPFELFLAVCLSNILITCLPDAWWYIVFLGALYLLSTITICCWHGCKAVPIPLTEQSQSTGRKILLASLIELPSM